MINFGINKNKCIYCPNVLVNLPNVKPKFINKSSPRQSFINSVAMSILEVNMRRRTEILNTLEQMVDALYEVGHGDAQYFEEIIGETMDIVMEYDE